MEKLYVIKVGGNIIDDDAKLKSFIKEFSSIKGKKILVHGGGKLATELASKLNIPQQLVDGRRITNAETLKVTAMVYAGIVNKTIVALLQSHQCNALGLSGADANIILAHKRVHASIDFGFVGDIDKVNSGTLTSLLQQDITIVLAPLTHDGKGQLLNTNADTIAQSVAVALAQNFDVELVYCFEKEGVLIDEKVLPSINKSEFRGFKESQQIFGGMIPKLENAFQALDSGVNVKIGTAEKIYDLVNGNTGTSIHA